MENSPESSPIALPTPVRFARSFDGANLACLAIGNGPALLECSTLAWTIGSQPPRPTPLLDSFRTAMFDRRGFGHSTVQTDATIEQFVQDAVAVADQLGFESFHVIGFSMGTLEAVRLACEVPERVRGLVLHAPYPSDWYEQPRAKAWRAALDTDWGWFAEAWTRTWGGPGQPATPEMIEHFKQSNNPEGFRAAVHAFMTAGTCDLARITAPTLVIHRAAKWQSIEVSERYAREIPGARLVVDHSPDAWKVATETETILQDFFVSSLPDREVPGSWRRPGAASANARSSATSLSPRELEVLRLLTAGLSNSQIASELSVSVLTVARHLHNIYDKLGVSNRAAAAAWAVRAQLG